MKFAGSIAQNIINYFNEDGQFSDLSFVIAYKNELKPTPLTKPIIAVSVKNCEIGKRISTSQEPDETGQMVEVTSRDARLTLSVDIYLPYSMGGNEGHKIFDRLAEFLLFKKRFAIIEAVCSETDYDSNCQAIVLRSNFIFKSVLQA